MEGSSMEATLVRGTRGHRIRLRAGADACEALKRGDEVRLGLHPLAVTGEGQRPGDLSARPMLGRLSIPGSWRLHVDVRDRSEEHTSELQSRENLVCRLLLEKKKKTRIIASYYTCNNSN